ncbi:SpoVG family protein [Christensenellaceae bacterium OttesenSCG-928-K19]|nr:SpoVG family protein [Christensenellaceae bacterium OttesenSCG-928-K19]
MSNSERAIKLDVRVYPIAEPKNSVMAFASATIDDIFAVNNIRVVNSDKGLFVAMPQVKDKEGQYRDICFPVTADLRKQLNESILGAYAAEKEKAPPAKESTTEKLREGAKDAKEQPAKTGGKSAPKKSAPEL